MDEENVKREEKWLARWVRKVYACETPRELERLWKTNTSTFEKLSPQAYGAAYADYAARLSELHEQ